MHVTAVTRESGRHLSEDWALRRGCPLAKIHGESERRGGGDDAGPNGKQRERPEVLDNVSRW